MAKETSHRHISLCSSEWLFPAVAGGHNRDVAIKESSVLLAHACFEKLNIPYATDFVNLLE